MRFTPEEINNIGVIVEGIEKVIEVISQQLDKFIYDASTKNFRLRKGEIVRNICKDVYQASCLYLTVSAPPSNLIEEILVRLYWDKREIAKDLKETYYQFINDVPKIFAIKDENNLYDELFNLKCNLSDLAKTLQAGANIAKTEAIQQAGTGQKIETQEKDGQSKTNITDYKALNLAKVPISRLIEQGESYTLEFKETLDYDTQNKGKNKDILLSSLKTIAGFLNATSGTLLIGVDDSGKIKGIGRDLSLMKNGNNDKFQLKIRNRLKDRFRPQPIGKVNISFDKFPEGTICRVDVQASEDIIHLNNRVYVREGNTTQLLDGRALTDWIQQRRLLTELPSGK